MGNLQRLFLRLKDLTAVPSTSGFEQQIAKKIYSEFSASADMVEADHVGNVYAYLKGASDTFRIMLPAHSDSVGMIVSHVEEDGYIRVDNIGRVPPNLIYAQRVIIMSSAGEKTGVVGSKPGHLAYGNSLAQSVPPTDALFIDVGAPSKAAATAMGIAPGQQVVFDRELSWLGDESSGLVSGRSLDDKAGCLVLLETMEKLRGLKKKLPASLIFVAAVQEEFGFRGAQIAGERIKPDICIGIDATISQAGQGAGAGIAPMPATAFSEAANALREGPGLSVSDQSLRTGMGLMGHPKLIAFLRKVAEENGIRYQIEGSMPGISSDASAVQTAGKGVPSMTIKIPSRYTHGPVEVVSLEDIQHTIDLLVQALPLMGPNFDLSFIDTTE
jgi:endoglucanase